MAKQSKEVIEGEILPPENEPLQNLTVEISVEVQKRALEAIILQVFTMMWESGDMDGLSKGRFKTLVNEISTTAFNTLIKELQK